MTPFGAKLRDLRAARGLTLTQMAADLGLSAAYLSALEHGRRARPTPGLVRQICAYFGIIWDDADELQAIAQRSRPRVTVDTGGLSPRATELANLLAERIGRLSDAAIEEVIEAIERATGPEAR
ncbi:MAG TPA: helix-turn-helix transcriptional regulator [Aliidongia sp.]|nr:helix-turn-helix transcriptional regulator [Aliidongia sp.]